MTIDACANVVRLSDIESWQIILSDVADEDVHPRFSEIWPLSYFRPALARKDNADTRPIHLIDDAQPFGVAIWNENADRVRFAHSTTPIPSSQVFRHPRANALEQIEP